MQQQQILSILTGLVGLGLLWIIILIATGRHIWALAIGEDGRPSTSKLQMLIWTGAVVFAFLSLFQIRFSAHFRDALPNIPNNLLVAMGISVVTAVSAKSIAVNAAGNNAANGGGNAPTINVGLTPAALASAPGAAPDLAVGAPPTVVAAAAAPAPVPLPATPVPPVQQNMSGIFCDDLGRPDLGKVQLMLWTFVAVGVFLADVLALINHPNCSPAGGSPCNVSLENLSLPDIGQTLMVLMGLGSGAYLGKKIVES